MAYGKKYHINWTTPTADCRLWIKQDGYTGGSVALDPAPTPVSIRWDEQGRDDLTSPLRISTARIRFIGDAEGEAVQEIFDGGDTEYQVKFWRDTGAGYELEWQGFLATDLWRDNPHTPAEVVELEAIDGLALLENRQAYTSDEAFDFYRLDDALHGILRYLHALPITTSQNWRPDGLALPSGRQPLDFIDLPDTAFQEIADKEEVEETLDQRTQLEGILERFGLQLMLSGGEWRLRQRGQIDDGTSLRQWTMGTSAGTFSTDPYVEDVTTSLPAVARTEKPRSRASRLHSLTSRYTYQDLGELVADGSFEDGYGAWTQVDSNATRVDYTDSPLATTSTQEDSFAVEMDYAFEIEEEQPKIHLRQELDAALQVAGPRGSYQFQYDEWVETGTSVIGATVAGQYELATERVAVASDAQAADDGTLIVDPIPGSSDTVVIPAGAVLPIDAPAPEDEVGYITLSEPAFGGDERLQGDISRKVKSGWKVKIYKWAPSTSGPSGVKGPRDLPAGEYQSAVQTIVVPQRTPQGDPVVGSMTVEMGTRDTANGNPTVWVDHVSVKVAVQGEPIEETNYQLTDTDYGRDKTLTHRIGDGPTKGHPRGLFDDGTTEVFRHWAPGPGQGETGKLLEQLLVEQWMRQQRETLDRRTYECELRGSDSLKAHHVVNFDSKTYTVSYLERSYGTEGDSARVELTELKDAGLAGLERTYSMESSGGSGSGGGSGGGFGGGSGGSSGGGGGGGGSSTWDQLSGKPSGLYAQGGAEDGFAETQALVSSNDDILELTDSGQLTARVKDEDDMASDSATHLATQQSIKSFVEGQTLSSQEVLDALGLQSSTFLEARNGSLHARVKDEDGFSSDSDTHLATQQSIKAYVQSATGSLAGLNDVDLSATDAGAQEGDLLAYNGSVWTDKDPSDIKAGNADKLDGYEATAFPRKHEDAFIDAQWTFGDDVELMGAELRTDGAAAGFSGSGTIVGDEESWFDDLQIRGTLFAREFEVRKVRASRGTRIFSAGGGKVKEVIAEPPNPTLGFSENPGIRPGDLCLIKEVDPETPTIASEIRMKATSEPSKLGGLWSVTFDVVIKDRDPKKGDDVVVVGSSDSERDSFLAANPYLPAFSTVDGVGSFDEWDTRTPGARLGDVQGMPAVDGVAPSGAGLWSNNAYIAGTIVANQGAIADSVTIGSTQAKDLASEGYVDQAEQAAIDYADGIDSSVRQDLNGILGDAVANGTTIIEGGVIATDLVTLDSVAFSPVESDSVIASINSSSEGIAINAAKLDIDASDLNISASDVEIGADTTFLSPEYDPTTKAPAADAGTIRSSTRPSARPSGEPLQAGDMWIDTSDGDRPYIYDGTRPYDSAGWDKAYTNIQGGDIDTNAISATEISVGSVQDIDSDAAIASDIFSGNYGDLSGTPSIPSGDLADLNEIDSTHIKDGAVVARTIAAGTALADKILANTATITAELEMGSAGQIVTTKFGSSDLAYEINDDGIYVADTEELVFGPNRSDGTIDRTQENRKGSLDVTALSAPDDAPESITNFFTLRGDKGAMLRARGLGNNVTVYEGGYTAYGVNLTATDDIKLEPDKYGSSGKVRVEGDLNYTGSLSSVSDRRAKADITSLENPLETTLQLEGKTYDKQGQREAGFIAQEVADVFDVAVSEMEELLGLSYKDFHALWAESIKELKAENDRLRKRINELESQI